MLGINGYTLLAIVIIAATIITITKLIIDTIKYGINQKNRNIKKCIKKGFSYKKNLKRYNQKLEKAGITSKKERKKIIKILETLYK